MEKDQKNTSAKNDSAFDDHSVESPGFSSKGAAALTPPPFQLKVATEPTPAAMSKSSTNAGHAFSPPSVDGPVVNGWFGGAVGGVIGGIAGAVGGFLVGGPVGAVAGGIGGAAIGGAIGHGVEESSHSTVEYDPHTAINVSYSVPLVNNNIEASAGETMIFGIEATDQDRTRGSASDPWTETAGGGPYETTYTVSGDAEFHSAGSGEQTATYNELSTRNVILVTKNTWTAGTITVTGVIKDKANNGSQDPDVTITWTIINRRGPAPTSLTKTGGPNATAWAAAPAVYGYKAGPDIGGDGLADYEGQTVLETFDPVTPLGFTMADLTDAWKAAHPSENTEDKVAKFLWDAGGNGTFVFDHLDQIYDQHGGFGDLSAFKPEAFDDADGVGYSLPQHYKVGATVIGNCTIDRRYTRANGLQIRKSDP